jgi:hypothetical protein
VFWRKNLPPSPGYLLFYVEVVGTFKTLITSCLTAWDHDPIGINVQDNAIPEKYVLLCVTDLVYVS